MTSELRAGKDPIEAASDALYDKLIATTNDALQPGLPLMIAVEAQLAALTTTLSHFPAEERAVLLARCLEMLPTLVAEACAEPEIAALREATAQSTAIESGDVPVVLQ